MIEGIAPLKLGYVVVFALTATACFATIGRARRRLDDPATRWGLVSLLAMSGLWASFHVGRLVAPQRPVKLTFYILGLIVGLASVGAWLYFCSAYAGKPYHTQRFFRIVAAVLFAGIVAVKITSPVHGLYFSATAATDPFPYLVVRYGVIHWVVTGLAYGLSAIGFFLLFELFQDSTHATTRLWLLIGLAGVPALLDIAAYLRPGAFVTLNYEPVGVGLFALGVLYVADGSFIAVQRFGRQQLFDELGEGVVLLDVDGIVQDVNDPASEMFPALADALGQPLTAVAPDLDPDGQEDRTEIVTVEGEDRPRHYLLSTETIAAGQTSLGELLILTDVTRLERQRRELGRQRSQLDDVSKAATHELRNTVNINKQYLELIEMQLDPEADTELAANVQTIAESTDRMARIVSDLAMLANHGEAVTETTTVDVEDIATRAFITTTEDPDRTLRVTAAHIEADGAQLYRIFETLFRFLIVNGATHVTVVGEGGELVVTGDGRPLSDADPSRLLTYGEAVPDAESGMLLPIVDTLAEAHGWSIAVDTAYDAGARIVIEH